MCQSKFFEPPQNSIYILCHSQTFCARQKDDLHSVVLVFEEALKVVKFLDKHFVPDKDDLHAVKLVFGLD